MLDSRTVAQAKASDPHFAAPCLCSKFQCILEIGVKNEMAGSLCTFCFISLRFPVMGDKGTRQSACEECRWCGCLTSSDNGPCSLSPVASTALVESVLFAFM